MNTSSRAPVVPLATYRLQLHAGFGFADVARIAPYLERLGISHVYCSPYLQAAQGSTHGYDVVDPRKVNEQLGGAEGHRQMCAVLGQCHLGQVLDLVPNHMSIADRKNGWWWDVLENGPSSRYASYFDVEWHPPEMKLRNTVLLPILGEHYGRAVEAGEIQLHRDGGSFVFRYHDHVVPVAPNTLDNLLAAAADRSQNQVLASLADALGHLPDSTSTDRTSIARRHRDKEVLRELLARLSGEQPLVAAAIDQVVAAINVEPDALDALLERQNYRLAFWRTAGQELGYRRFFDINSLISLCMEDEQVFADTHALVLSWLAAGVIDGLRIDHPDGLRDPEAYFDRLRAAAPDAWIVAEKILEPGEQLPGQWPIAGTTGYDFLYRVDAVFVDPQGAEPLGKFYGEFTGEDDDYARQVHANKLLVLKTMFGSDMNRLANLFGEICERHRRYRDYTRPQVQAMLREVIACLGVYRTYARPDLGYISEQDALVVAATMEAAREQRPDFDVDLFQFCRDILLLRVRGSLESEFVYRFQQLTGAVMAKGVEDTTFYNYFRLASLNEVGGDPGRFGLSLADFHAASQASQAAWPSAMLATSTHDTKRAEDVRIRIGLLAQIPERWSQAVRRWAGMNQRCWYGAEPDRNSEYFFYQTLVGAWPLEVERATAYMLKAAREAKRHTSWTNVNESYEETLREFVVGTLEQPAFVADVTAFVEPLIEPAQRTSLAQTLIKLTAPGAPDFYQGTEIWNLSLVDPDNRRPVDYELRLRMLVAAEQATAVEAWRRRDEGLAKIWLIQRVLKLRRQRAAAFASEAIYEPLLASGPGADQVIAFCRGGQAVTVVPRLALRPGPDSSPMSLALPAGRWENIFTGECFEGQLAVPALFQRFPTALLVSTKQNSSVN